MGVTNEYFPVFLYRYDDANGERGASTVAFGEQRQVNKHYPSVVIGVATRPVGDPIEHDDAPPEYEAQLWERWREHVEEKASEVRWFVDEPLQCDPDEVVQYNRSMCTDTDWENNNAE